LKGGIDLKNKIKTWGKTECNKGALPISKRELIDMGISEKDIDKGESRGKFKTIPPWGIPVTYRAMVMSRVYTPKEKQRYIAETETVTMYGIRTMGKISQSGYEIEGWLSLNGKKTRGFSSSQLFELENGKLVDIAIIHARIRETFVECGSCGEYHRQDYRGDCRNDSERFSFENIPDGSTAIEIDGNKGIKQGENVT